MRAVLAGDLDLFIQWHGESGADVPARTRRSTSLGSSSSMSGIPAAYASATSAPLLVSEGCESGAVDRTAGTVPVGSMGAYLSVHPRPPHHRQRFGPVGSASH